MKVEKKEILILETQVGTDCGDRVMAGKMKFGISKTNSGTEFFYMETETMALLLLNK